MTMIRAIESPPVSIVIPAYNHAEYLPQAIDSVLSQDYPDLELIVLDDGSSDDTPEIMARYRHLCRMERHENVGQAATLNKGWAMARGEILGYLSADDFLLPEAISRSVDALLAHPGAPVVYCDFNLVDPTGRTVRRVRAARFSMDEMLTRLACPPGPGALFRRSAYEKAGGWDHALRQMPDFDFWLRVALHGSFAHLGEPLAAWRVHEQSQSFGSVSESRAAEPIVIIERIFDDAELPPGLAALRSRALARAHLISAQLHARSGRYRRALREFALATRLWPATLASAEVWSIAANALAQRPAHRLLWKLRSATRRSAG